MHGDVGGHVGGGLVFGILDRLVDGQEPAVSVVGDDGFDGVALEERRQVRLEAWVKRQDFTWLAGFFAAFQGRVEYRMTAVFFDLVNVEVFCLRETFLEFLQFFFCFCVSVGFTTACEEFVYAVTVNEHAGRLGYPVGDIGELVDGNLLVQEITDGTGR